jgi:hypothetical protein
VVGRGVPVEKLAHSEFAKIGSRLEAIQTIFLSILDIFYHPNFGFFLKTRVFQQPPPVRNTYLEIRWFLINTLQVQARCFKVPATRVQSVSRPWQVAVN